MTSSLLHPVRGTRDYYAHSMAELRHIMDTARHIAARYRFDELCTPTFEYREVFHRSLGESSDVVHKETYSFADRGGDAITLRPEFTASVVRALLFNGWTQQLPFKAYYQGPAFRYERPQKGRLRQFHQVGVECLGAKEPWHDAEAIACACDVLAALLPSGANGNAAFTLKLNTLGDQESRQRYRATLVQYFERYQADLSEESRERLQRNPLRILDSKQEADQPLIQSAPRLRDALNDASRAWFATVQSLLEALGIRYEIADHLVRGIDYYTHTVFECTTRKLGSQATILAGGRYDGLVKAMGGPDLPGFGWAAGVERLMLLRETLAAEAPASSGLPLLLIAMTAADYSASALGLARACRAAGLPVEVMQQRHIGKAVKKANQLGASHFLACGEDEAANQRWFVKTLATGAEREHQSAETLIAQLQDAATATAPSPKAASGDGS